MAGSDFISNDRMMSRYLPVTNRDERGRTPAVQAVEERVIPDESYAEFQGSVVTFASRMDDKELHAAFRDT